jgi:hypothetical protein
LAEAGWASPRLNRGAIATSHAASFRNARGGEFDLHWHFLPETSGNRIEARFWLTARPFNLDGIATRMLDPALALVHALVHGLRSNPLPPVRWIADALILIRRSQDLEWRTVVDFGRAGQLTQRLHLGLGFLARHFNAPIPSATLRELASSHRGFMERTETAAVLYQTRGLMGNAAVKPFIVLTDYLRQADETGLRRLPGFMRYIRRRLAVNAGLNITERPVDAGVSRRLASD